MIGVEGVEDAIMDIEGIDGIDGIGMHDIEYFADFGFDTFDAVVDG